MVPSKFDVLSAFEDGVDVPAMVGEVPLGTIPFTMVFVVLASFEQLEHGQAVQGGRPEAVFPSEAHVEMGSDPHVKPWRSCWHDVGVLRGLLGSQVSEQSNAVCFDHVSLFPFQRGGARNHGKNLSMSIVDFAAHAAELDMLGSSAPYLISTPHFSNFSSSALPEVLL